MTELLDEIVTDLETNITADPTADTIKASGTSWRVTLWHEDGGAGMGTQLGVFATEKAAQGWRREVLDVLRDIIAEVIAEKAHDQEK